MRPDKRPGRPKRVRLKREVRRELIVEAAFEALAKEGFEGLRTRDIAARIGINSATLHHYFPTKDDLIAAAADHLESRLRADTTVSTEGAVPSALSILDGQFADVVRYQADSPEILAVYREFVARAPRDRAIHALVVRLHAGWRSGIVAALIAGQRDGSLRADMDPEATAGLVLSTTWGLVSQIFTSKEQLEAAVRQLRAWLLPPGKGRSAGRQGG